MAEGRLRTLVVFAAAFLVAWGLALIIDRVWPDRRLSWLHALLMGCAIYAALSIDAALHVHGI
jgi:hypothetical protein